MSSDNSKENAPKMKGEFVESEKGPTPENERNQPSEVNKTPAGSNVKTASNVSVGVDKTEDEAKPKHNFVRCEICSCEMSSNVVLTAHINGSRHKKKVKALEIVASLKASGERGIDVESEASSNVYRCDLCYLSVNSPQQMEIHLAGSKHKNRLSKATLIHLINNGNSSNIQGEEVIDYNSERPPSKKRKKDTMFLTCFSCNIVTNSEIQYEQHLLSKKHKAKSGAETQLKDGTCKMENEESVMTNFSQQVSHVDNLDSEKYISSNHNSIYKVNSSNNHSNVNVKQKQSEGVNHEAFNNQLPSSQRHSTNNSRVLRSKSYGNVNMQEIKRFFNQVRPVFFSSNNSGMQTFSKS